MLILRVHEPGKEPREVRANHTPFRIGRADDCDLILDDEQISSVHAELAEVDDVWIFRDTGSTNGLWIDGKRIEQLPVHTSTELFVGPIKIEAVPGTEWLQEIAGQAETVLTDTENATRVMQSPYSYGSDGPSTASTPGRKPAKLAAFEPTRIGLKKEPAEVTEPSWMIIGAWASILILFNAILLYVHSAQDLLVSSFSSVFMIFGSALLAGLLSVFSRLVFKRFYFRAVAWVTVVFGVVSVAVAIGTPFLAPWFTNHESFVALERTWALLFDFAFFYVLFIKLSPQSTRQNLALVAAGITLFFFLGGELIRGSETFARFRHHRDLPLPVKQYSPNDFNKAALFSKFDQSMKEIGSDRARVLSSVKERKQPKPSGAAADLSD
jgi:hypothetical protein